jgi:hypothetical protein
MPAQYLARPARPSKVPPPIRSVCPIGRLTGPAGPKSLASFIEKGTSQTIQLDPSRRSRVVDDVATRDRPWPRSCDQRR